MKKACAFCLLLTLTSGIVSFAPTAHAQIVVRDVIRHMLPTQRPIENATVKNTSKEQILRADIEVQESKRTDTFEEVLSPSKDFIVAPKSMILRPEEERIARLVLRKPPEELKERYYRVNFRPAIPRAEELRELGVTQEEIDRIKAKVNLISGTGIFITIAPQKMNPKLAYERDATGITFKNEGNISIDMRSRQDVCLTDNNCVDLPYKRLYPGQSWRYEVAGEHEFVYYYNIYDKSRSLQLEPAGE